MANVLNEEKKQQILALGRLGWSLRRIQQATRVRRETISGYRKAVGITVWRPGGWSRQGQPKPAMQVITGSMPELPALNPNINPENLPDKRTSNCEDSKPAIQVTTGFGVELRGPEATKPSSLRSACEPFQQAIRQGQHEQPRAPILTALRVARHGHAAVIDLGFFSWCGEDDSSRLRRLRSAQSINVSPNTLVAGAKAMVGH